MIEKRELEAQIKHRKKMIKDKQQGIINAIKRNENATQLFNDYDGILEQIHILSLVLENIGE